MLENNEVITNMLVTHAPIVIVDDLLTNVSITNVVITNMQMYFSWLTRETPCYRTLQEGEGVSGVEVG